MKHWILVICLGAVGWTNVSLAYDKANLKALKRTGDCIGCDLSGADLSWLDLRGSNLSAADLTRANFAHTKL